jgi:hypothetical protein
VPLSVDEATLGEMLRGAKPSLALSCRKQVMVDHAGFERLQLEGGSELATWPLAGGWNEPGPAFGSLG